MIEIAVNLYGSPVHSLTAELCSHCTVLVCFSGLIFCILQIRSNQTFFKFVLTVPSTNKTVIAYKALTYQIYYGCSVMIFVVVEATSQCDFNFILKHTAVQTSLSVSILPRIKLQSLLVILRPNLTLF